MNRNNTNLQSYARFPQKEEAYALFAGEHIPFSVACVGLTYPYPDYSIHRDPGHSVHVFEYILEGEGELLLHGEWRRIKAGDSYLLRAGEEHRYRAVCSNPWKKLWINYTADYLPAFLDAYGLKTNIFACPEAQKYFDIALETARLGKNDVTVGRTVAECVHKLASLFAASLQMTPTSDEHRICAALNAALYQRMDLNRLSDMLHISKSNLIRIFKKHYGITPYEYLLNAKIEVAKALLNSTQISVKELAERLGFSDEHYFSTLFCKRVGIRLREFRNSNM